MDVGALVAAVVALAVAVGGYVQFVLQRSIFPCIEFDADLVSLSRPAAGRHAVGEVVLSMKNVGPGVGFVANVRYRVRYRRADETGLGPDGVEPAFTHALTQGFALMHDATRNFIQPGVTHWYRKPLSLPEDANLVHVWGSFEYHIDVGRVAWVLARFLTQRPDQRLVPYTVRRTFQVGDGTQSP
jgi:hypothetical protein